jgi:hypothetical protein
MIPLSTNGIPPIVISNDEKSYETLVFPASTLILPTFVVCHMFVEYSNVMIPPDRFPSKEKTAV